MDRQIIDEKLESLRRCLARISEKRPPTADKLANDPDLQDIITLNLTRAVQLCVDLSSHLISDLEHTAPATMGETFTILADEGVIPGELAERLGKAVGFRNIAVHNYQKIDWHIVHAIANNHLDDFTRFAEFVASHGD